MIRELLGAAGGGAGHARPRRTGHKDHQGHPTEVALDKEDGMPVRCCLTLDNVTPIRASLCTELITTLSGGACERSARAVTMRPWR